MNFSIAAGIAGGVAATAGLGVVAYRDQHARGERQQERLLGTRHGSGELASVSHRLDGVGQALAFAPVLAGVVMCVPGLGSRGMAIAAAGLGASIVALAGTAGRLEGLDRDFPKDPHDDL